jgi:uncharacterized protein YkwD
MRFQRVTALVAAFALAAPLLAFHETRPNSMAAAIVDEMNRERAAQGLPALHINDELSAVAVDRVDDMFAKHYFGHVSPDGIEPWTWADKHGYNYREFGENLAVGYRTPQAIVDGWMHSPEHRKNVLSAAFEDVGVAIAPASPERRFAGPTVVAIYGVR